MKKVFIYYSYSGNGDLVAKYYKEKGYEIEEIVTREPLPDNKFLAILTGGFKALINYKDKIEKSFLPINEYDEIVIGSPIWNGRLSSPVNAFLANHDIVPKAFVLYSGSGKSPSATKTIIKKYPSSMIINLTEPKKHEEEFKDILNKKGQ